MDVPRFGYHVDLEGFPRLEKPTLTERFFHLLGGTTITGFIMFSINYGQYAHWTN